MTVTRCPDCGAGFVQPNPSEVYGRGQDGRRVLLRGAAAASRYRALVAEYYRECNEHSCAQNARQQAANMEIVREYVTNPEFRQALHDYSFAVTYKP